MRKNRSQPKCGHSQLNERCIICAELVHYWNARLEDSGIVDIDFENESRPPSALLHDDGTPFEMHPKTEYYSKLFQMTNAEKFEDKSHEFIMRKVSEGAKIVEIIRELDEKGKPIHRETVRFIIRRFEDKWGIRKWEMRQKWPWKRNQTPHTG